MPDSSHFADLYFTICRHLDISPIINIISILSKTEMALGRAKGILDFGGGRGGGAGSEK